MAASDEPSGLQQFETLSRPTFSRQEYEIYMKVQGRRPEILTLIERFYHQLRYGCVAATCDTKTCRTNRAQVKGAPYRVPTATTARTLATFMAALDEPHRCLCPNIPAPMPSPFDTAFPTSKRLYSLGEASNGYLDHMFSWVQDDMTPLEAAGWFAKAEVEEWMVVQALSDSSIDLQSPKPYPAGHRIDTKSFTQKLFNTSIWDLTPSLQDNPISNAMSAGIRSIKNDSDLSREVVLQLVEDAGGFSKVSPILPDSNTCYDFLNKAYFDNEFWSRIPIYEQSLLENGSDGLTLKVNRIKLCETFSDPVMLMTRGNNPFPRSFTTTNARSQDVRSVLSGFRSQPLSVIYLEFTILKQISLPSNSQHLRWLASSVKSAYLKPGLTNNLPSPAAAHVVAVAISALLAYARGPIWPEDFGLWDHFEKTRQKGLIQCNVGHDHDYGPLVSSNAILAEWILGYEDPVAQNLMRLVLRTFASWSYASSQLGDSGQSSEGIDATDNAVGTQETWGEFKDRLLDCFCPTSNPTDLGRYLIRALIEWARVIFLRDWKGEARFQWNTDVGAAVDFMSWLYDNRIKLGVSSKHFVIGAFIKRMDYVEASKDWLDFKTTPLTGHLLSLPWMLSTNAKFTIFRTISLCRMVIVHESAETMNSMISRMSPYVKLSYRQLFYKLSKYTETFLVLDIRRDNILRDCFNQLWRRQKKELLRPLKVRMGMDEGEEGVDMGGVQQEFFRLVIAEALDSRHGLFTTDPTTRMTWFQPMSPAPLHQFTLIGLIFGLALYNGITLTVTFPLAFYRKLLGMENTELEHIKDGWPELHSGMSSLLSWSDGKVEDIFLRSYTFSFEAFGTVHHVNMQRFPRTTPPTKSDISLIEPISKGISKESGSSTDESLSAIVEAGAEDAGMVTADNRAQYVSEYVYWLTDRSIAAQFEAFRAGFNLPLHKKALSLLSPLDLQTLLEGHQTINVDGLREAAFYEDKYDANHPKIKEFWEIVQDMTGDQHKKLLEFVTASPRVPARGIEEVEFTIQRNGVGDEHLPTSMTCFGRLLLPEYSSKEIMKEKLMLAIENSIGFGTQ